MKDEKRKYIIVDAKDINITLRKLKRVSGFNDFWNEYNPIGETTAKKIFEQYQIPENFQKIAFALPTCKICYSNGQEVLTGRPFQIFKSTQKNHYYAQECARWYAGDTIGGSLHFTTPKQNEKYNSVLSFYEQLAEQGYLEQYVNAIKNMFFLENELQSNNEEIKIEDKAATLIKTKQNKKAS